VRQSQIPGGRQLTRADLPWCVKEGTKTHTEPVFDEAFSGHGSDTHELVTYDFAPWNLRATGLPLSELTTVSAVPARQLVVVLDCCFSGGVGAKVGVVGAAGPVAGGRDNGGQVLAERKRRRGALGLEVGHSHTEVSQNLLSSDELIRTRAHGVPFSSLGSSAAAGCWLRMRWV